MTDAEYRAAICAAADRGPRIVDHADIMIPLYARHPKLKHHITEKGIPEIHLYIEGAGWITQPYRYDQPAMFETLSSRIEMEERS